MPRDRFKLLLSKRHAYQMTFGSPEGQYVLRDLMKFCGMRQEQFVPGDPERTTYLLGRRRVGLRIAAMINLSDAELMRLSDQPEEAEDGQD